MCWGRPCPKYLLREGCRHRETSIFASSCETQTRRHFGGRAEGSLACHFLPDICRFPWDLARKTGGRCGADRSRGKASQRRRAVQARTSCYWLLEGRAGRSMPRRSWAGYVIRSRARPCTKWLVHGVAFGRIAAAHGPRSGVEREALAGSGGAKGGGRIVHRGALWLLWVRLMRRLVSRRDGAAAHQRGLRQGGGAVDVLPPSPAATTRPEHAQQRSRGEAA